MTKMSDLHVNLFEVYRNDEVVDKSQYRVGFKFEELDQVKEQVKGAHYVAKIS